MRKSELIDISDGLLLKSDSIGNSPNEVYTKPVYRYYVLSILTLVYAFNFVDRQLLVILQEPIKADLDLSDTQLGLLTGFSFALFYVICGIPIARWADRGSRRTIISLALTLWSFMTAVSGLTQTYTQLLLARIGVGVGEAGGSPPAHSMISDIFSPVQRATALSVYSIGISIGILVGFLAGGWLNEFFNWRVAFLVVGLPGIFLALVLRFTVQEPPRGWSQNNNVDNTHSSPPFIEVLKLLWSRHSFRHLALASGLQAFVAYGLGNWFPSYFLRTFDIGIGELGTWLALAAGFGGGAGTLLGGYLTDHLGVKEKRWYLWLLAISMLAIVPLLIILLTNGDLYFSLFLTTFLNLLISVYAGPILAVTHSLVGLRMRALSSAVLLFVLNLVGMGLGPTAVGLLSDLLATMGTQNSLRWAMLWAGTTASLLCCLHYLLAARSIRKDLENAPA